MGNHLTSFKEDSRAAVSGAVIRSKLIDIKSQKSKRDQELAFKIATTRERIQWLLGFYATLFCFNFARVKISKETSRFSPLPLAFLPYMALRFCFFIKWILRMAQSWNDWTLRHNTYWKMKSIGSTMPFGFQGVSNSNIESWSKNQKQDVPMSRWRNGRSLATQYRKRKFLFTRFQRPNWSTSRWERFRKLENKIMIKSRKTTSVYPVFFAFFLLFISFLKYFFQIFSFFYFSSVDFTLSFQCFFEKEKKNRIH